MQSFAGSFKGRLQPRTFVRTVTDLSGGRSSGVTLTNESTPRRLAHSLAGVRVLEVLMR